VLIAPKWLKLVSYGLHMCVRANKGPIGNQTQRIVRSRDRWRHVP